MPDYSFKQLRIWQKAKIIALEAYKLTANFPKSEIFGLSGKMRRDGVSMSSNIAEGYVRQHDKERTQFLRIAYGSGAELESQIEIAKTLYPDHSYDALERHLTELMKMLNVMLHKESRAKGT